MVPRALGLEQQHKTMKQTNKKEKKQGTKTERGGDKCMKKRVLMGKSDNHKAHTYKKKRAYNVSEKARDQENDALHKRHMKIGARGKDQKSVACQHINLIIPLRQLLRS